MDARTVGLRLEDLNNKARKILYENGVKNTDYDSDAWRKVIGLQNAFQLELDNEDIKLAVVWLRADRGRGEGFILCWN